MSREQSKQEYELIKNCELIVEWYEKEGIHQCHNCGAKLTKEEKDCGRLICFECYCYEQD